MARKKSFGMRHGPTKTYRASTRIRTERKLHVQVKVGRSGENFTAIACVTGMKAAYLGKGAHCSGLRGGASPTKAAANALAELSTSLHKYGR